MSRRLLGAALLVAAGVAAVVGTFLPLFWEGSDFGGARFGFTTTSWQVVNESADPESLLLDRSPQYGVPIVIAAVVLGIAAAMVSLPESQRLAARYTAIGGAGLLAGSVWTTGAVVASAVADLPEGVPAPPDYSADVGEGIWVLVASVVLAFAGVVLVHARGAEPRPDGPVVYRVDGGSDDDDDMDTPPFGIPVQGVEVAQIPESEYERPFGAPGDDPDGKAT